MANPADLATWPLIVARGRHGTACLCDLDQGTHALPVAAGDGSRVTWDHYRLWPDAE